MKLKIEPIILIIIVIATFLRLQNLWYVEFKGDEAENSFLVTNLIYQGIFPLIGDMSSIRVFNPPMFVYLLTIPFMISKNPVVASGFVALLNILAVYICFLFCKKFFNRRIALFASAFFALNPWVIFYSRKIWANNLLTVFILIFFYSLYEVVIHKKQKYILLSCVSFGIFTQLHLSTLYFLFLWFLVFLIFKPKVQFKYFLIGAGILVLLYSPYILFELQNNFYNVKAFFAFSKMPFKLRMEGLVMPFRLATTHGFPSSFNFLGSNIFQMALLGAAILYLLCNFKNRKYSIVLFWFFLPILILTISKKYTPNHYFICLFPSQFIMLAILLDKICCVVQKSHVVVALSLVLLLSQGICSFEFFNKTIRGSRNIYWMGYGPPFKYRVEEIKQVMNKGFQDVKKIHRVVSQDKSRFKYDFLATRYIVDNMEFIHK